MSLIINRYNLFISFWMLTLSIDVNSQTETIQYCEAILSKSELSISDFENLDSALFNLNYYVSETPLQLYQLARKKAYDQGLKSQAAYFERWISDLYFELSNQDSSAWYGRNAAQVFKTTDDELGFARTANIRRNIHSASGDFDKAYEICFEALEIFERYDDPVGIAITYRDIGSIKMQENKIEEGLEYCEKGVEALVETENWYEVNFAYQRLAIAHRNLNNFEMAHNYLQKAMEACRKLSYFRAYQGLAKLYWTKGYIYEKEEKYKLALSYADSASYYAEPVGYQIINRAVSNFKGGVFLQQENFEKALNEFEKSIAVTNSLGNTQSGYDFYNPVYQNIVEAYKGQGNYKLAFEYLEKIGLAKDSIFNLESERQVSELQTKYETGKKEQALADQQDQLDQQKTIQLMTVGIASLFAFLLVVLFLFFRKNRKTTAQLQKKNDENELLLQEIHHRVKNNLQTISSLLSLQSESIDNPSAFNAVQESKNRVASMALIHQKLYQGENLASIEMRNYFKTMGSAIIDGFGELGKEVDLVVEMDKLELDADAAIPIGLITNELITNSLKYAFPERKGKITIQLSKVENNLFQLVISDDGVGTSAEIEKEKESGFGSLLINLLTAQLQGKIDISNENGTAITIQFPPPIKSAA